MKCPVCKTDCMGYQRCPDCGFDELNKVFINLEEALFWEQKEVIPYRNAHFFPNCDFGDTMSIDDIISDIKSTMNIKIPNEKYGKIFRYIFAMKVISDKYPVLLTRRY